MQQQQGPVALPELAKGHQAPTTGPVVLDLDQLALVSGGSPKGGWIPPAPSAAEATQGNW